MKLDRNINPSGLGKYALLKLRNMPTENDHEPFSAACAAVDSAIRVLEEAGILDWGNKPETEFFVIRIKDVYATAALEAYANSALMSGDDEYAGEIMEMVGRSGVHSEFCQQPD